MLKKGIILSAVFCLFTAFFLRAVIYAGETNAKAKIQALESTEEAEGIFTQKVKIEILDGDFKGLSIFMDYTGDIKLREADQIFVKLIENEGEINKAEYTGLNRTNYMLWLSIIAGVILVSITGKHALSSLGPTIFILACVFSGILPKIFDDSHYYIATIILIVVSIILTNILTRGLEKFTFISIFGGIAGIIITAVVQIAFSESIRLPEGTYEVANAGVLLAASGMIASNATQIVFGLKEKLSNRFGLQRTEILNEGIAVSRDFSSAQINTLVYCFVGLNLAAFLIAQESGINGIFSLLNDPRIAYIVISMLSTAIGILIVPVCAVVMSFLIIDVDSLGRRLPKKKQLTMEV